MKRTINRDLFMTAIHEGWKGLDYCDQEYERYDEEDNPCAVCAIGAAARHLEVPAILLHIELQRIDSLRVAQISDVAGNKETAIARISEEVSKHWPPEHEIVLEWGE